MDDLLVEFPPDCEEVVRGLWDFLDGELDERSAVRFARHLEACQYCRAHAAFERRLVAELARLRRQVSEPAALLARVKAALEAARGDS